MLYQDLLAAVKAEARIKQGDDFDSIVLGILNEAYKEAVQNNRPFELRDSTTLNLTTATSRVALPVNFFFHHQVNFKDANTSRVYPLNDQDDASQPAPRGMYGHPKSFEVVTGNQLFLNPWDQIVSGDQIILVYYKIPPIITEDNLTEENPIIRLEPFLIRSAIRRVRLFHSDDVQVAQLLSGDIQSAAIGYTHDEPEKPEPPR